MEPFIGISNTDPRLGEDRFPIAQSVTHAIPIESYLPLVPFPITLDYTGRLLALESAYSDLATAHNSLLSYSASLERRISALEVPLHRRAWAWFVSLFSPRKDS